MAIDPYDKDVNPALADTVYIEPLPPFSGLPGTDDDYARGDHQHLFVAADGLLDQHRVLAVRVEDGIGTQNFLVPDYPRMGAF